MALAPFVVVANDTNDAMFVVIEFAEEETIVNAAGATVTINAVNAINISN